jgi:DNA gyrase subunit B
MPELIESGYVYIAQPPLFKVKRGKREEYIKDERSMVRYLMRQATTDIKVSLSEKDIVLEGRDLARLLEQMVEFNRFREKAVRRLGNDDLLLDTLLEAFVGKSGVLASGQNLTLRSVFQNPQGKQISRIEESLVKAGYHTDLSTDEEHGLWEIETEAVNSVKVKIDWELVSHVEFQKTIELYKSLEEHLPAPFSVGENGSSEQVQTRQLLLDRVLAAAKKDLTIQRYKGLGEMNPEQLWETTMNPERRTLLQVKIDDAVETDQIFTILMGDAVEPRRRFIENNALEVKNLDV